MAGNANSGRKLDKLWGDALRVAVLRPAEDGRQRLAHIAEQTALAAMGGDMQAIREIGDRLDGKPAQAVEATGNLTIVIAAQDEGFT